MPLNSAQLAQIPAVQAAADASSPDYKALVCVFLNGGNDSHNTVIPRGANYTGYAAARPDLAIAEGSILPLAGTTAAGLHPNCVGMQAMWDAGDMAIIPNIGPMVEPMTKAEYGTAFAPGSAKVRPINLQSHSDQQLAWNSGLPGESGPRTGWGGRLHDLIEQTYNSTATAPATLTIAGRTRFQEGNAVNQYQIGPDGPTLLQVNDQYAGVNGDTTTVNTIFDLPYTHLMERELARIAKRGVQYAQTVIDASTATFTTVFPTTPLGRQLERVAVTIAARVALGHRRQLFFTQMGGFDTHSNLVVAHAALMTDLSAALKAFNDAMIEIGLNDQVTLFTQSDFGRALYQNSGGSDHGWGGASFVIGGSVAGGQFYYKPTINAAPINDHPDISIDGPHDGGEGRMVPTTSTDELQTTLIKWYGIPDAARAVIVPNFASFSHPDLGFMV